MALTPEQVREMWENYSPTKGIESFVRSVEAEVRKDDEALLAEARAELQWWVDNHRCCAGHEEDLLDRLDARLEKAP